MAFTLKNQREIESDIHEQLYTNILILTFEYPTTKEFNTYFKKDMFVKNNKAAFQHIVHFLLNVLDPQLFKQKIIWPILDGKMETQFRNEVMKFINELNTSNKETGIPLIMTSHLISPGGYKFAEFIFRLSQFVNGEHIKRKEGDESVIFPPKADNDYSISLQQVSNWNKIVDDQTSSLSQKQMSFESKYIWAKQREKYIIEQIPVVEKSAVDTEQNINELFESSDKMQVIDRSSSEREELIEQKLNQIGNSKSSLEECSKLVDILNKSNRNEGELLYPDVQTNEHPFESKANLITSLENFLETLRSNKSTIKNRKYHHLPESVKMCLQIMDELNVCNSKYEELASELQFHYSQLEELVASYSINEYCKHDSLSQKIIEIFERIQSVTISANC